MSLILTTTDGKEIREQSFSSFECDLTNLMTFQLTIPSADFDSYLVEGARVYVPGTEFGGIIGITGSNTKDKTVTMTGHNWRGLLNYKVISPPAGADYKIVSGELNSIIRGLIADANISNLFVVPEVSTGITLSNYKFYRYATLYQGIEKMLNEVQNLGDYPPYRMDLKFTQAQAGLPGYVSIQAVEAVDYSETIELSQDNRLDFTIQKKRDGVNHLICLGQGELAQRTVRHLYADRMGKISQTQTLFGVDEIVEIYDNSGAENPTTLIEEGTKRMQEVTNNETFEMDAAELNIDVAIGDKIGGRDYITGITCADYVTNKIYKIENGATSIEYTIGGDRTDYPIVE